jgi:copper transport protein
VAGRAQAFVMAAVAGALALAGQLAVASPAAAHATLQSTDPPADVVLAVVPAEVVLTFDEPVSIALGGGIEVYAPDGQRIDTREASTDGATMRIAIGDGGRGTYTVGWRTVSEDAHVIAGSFVFHVGERTSAADVSGITTERDSLKVLAIGARWLVFAGLLVTGGIAAFRLATRRRPELAGPALRRQAIIGALLIAVGSALRMLVQIAQSSGESLIGATALVGDSLGARTGKLDAIRVLASLAAIGAVVAWRDIVSATTSIIAVAGVALANAASGHAWTADHRLATVATDVAHQLGAAVWVGGLVALPTTARSHPQWTEWAARRLSTLALGAVGVVAATGAWAGWQQLGGLDELLSSDYGRALTAKTIIVAVMVGFGWLNREYLIELVATRPRPLLRSVRAETALAVVVVALAATLVGLAPSGSRASSEAAAPFRDTRADDAGTVELIVDPALQGLNDLHVSFFDAAGAPRAVDAVQITVATGSVPPRTLPVTAISRDHASADGASLTPAGTWLVTITSVYRGEQAVVTFEVNIP